MHRHIIHLHISAFSIAVARVFRPELRERPVAVAPARSERALILSASSEARKEGAFKGMPLSKAVKLCPTLMVLPPDPGLTEKACHTLARVVARYTPLWEPARPGHVYLDVTGTERLWGRAKDTAYHLKKEIEDRMSLPGTVGVAGNKMVSNIASRIIPSSGLMDVNPGREGPFMAPLKVGVVPGIGCFRKKVLLEELSITRVRELAALDMGRLKLVFGRQAFVIHQRALGIDPAPVCPATEKPVVSEDVTLAQDENDDEKLLGTLYGLVEKCALKMRKRALFPRKAGLLIRYSDQMEIKRQIKLSLTSFWDFDLYPPLESLFLNACKRRVRVRFIRVWFWDFSCSSGQLSLFHTPSPALKKSCLVIQALDCIRKRHGEGVIKYGRTA
ncbi:MAG: DNA polymerase IV [Deltaproteobacteria bacterium]|nr:DNA polymerase IV [Deltaproteobacteria bacterium]MBW2344840.1 DNA polymerase IV [Deltaproteobacteria bacterium]